MTIQKKSLLSSLNTTKKAIVASSNPNHDNPRVNAPVSARVTAKIKARVVAKVMAKAVARTKAF